MTQLEFILQPKEEQLEIIDTFGFEVAKKNDKKHASVFYCVDSFFVEVKSGLSTILHKFIQPLFKAEPYFLAVGIMYSGIVME